MIKKPHDKFIPEEKIILRDYLAMERTRLANERTLFSYIRTSLYLILAGIALIQLRDFSNIRWLGYLLLILSLIILIAGLVNYLLLRRTLTGFYNFKFDDSAGEQK